ncbi:NUDIX hydrolase N-terminal domain-containing protein [Enterococcus sp. 5H]|uniref:NUDIX hydrolase N-terminal domain-containing protein n=1 Tax=Enterococcus sp. 5H TaxID=1229490 RepID=UPI002303CD01|nr:NUDIX hydrolase N-terminal domain-containing protein [Enterococcus sp. 5H]MDA9470264.1 ADP-ribose pyrophosphatase [Enterococcus sp. 5H]
MEKELSILLAKLQGIAQTGKKYGNDIFDLERYEELAQITKELTKIIYPAISDQKLSIIIDKDEGYATPKVDIRAVVFNSAGKLLLVKEKSDNAWSLPGGWADIGYSPKEIAEKETFEEAGILVKAQYLIAVLDKAKHDYPAALTYVYKFFIRCEPLNEQLKTGVETEDAQFFSLPEISMLILSEERVIMENIEMIFNDYHNKKDTLICD